MVDALLASLSALLLDGTMLYVDGAAGDALQALADEQPSGERLVRLNRLLLNAAYPGALLPADTKRVLRFDGEDQPQLALRLTPGAVVDSGQLTTIESFSAHRPVALAGAPAAAKTGIDVDAQRWTAAPVQPAAPVLATGLDVALLVPVAGTQVRLELRADHDGGPVHHRPVGDERWSAARADGLAPLVRVTTASGGASETPAVELRVRDLPVPHTRHGDETRYDLSGAVRPSPTSAASVIPLVFSAVTTGSLTAQAPRITYDLPS